ncbi:hypothetical protein BTK96_002697 [Burkholderia pyrrocinia]|uniref:hypothetical protein n=1 Tax=Burkholderia sp. IT-111MI5 TaxID=3026439 RepID=UPI002A2D778E|nr:hypothetical protein [Burkholderia pyrrocinia]EKS9894829.1 hypothetical protein [Burkholderia pyrrocinia]EKS9907486.1 hypothetical protein [Burkholderia pyrrocinia]
MADDCDACRCCDKRRRQCAATHGRQVSPRVPSNARQRYLRVLFQVTAGSVSTRIGVACSDMTCRLGGEFEDFDCSKKASVCRALVTLPLVRSRHGSVSVRFAYESRKVRLGRD